jgi:hypothetical protein
VGINYRRVLTPELAAVLDKAEQLATLIEPNWLFDPDTGGFYVIADGTRYDIVFATNDVETEFVCFASRYLGTLVEAARGRFIDLDRST